VIWMGSSVRVMKERMAAAKDGSCLLIWSEGDNVLLEYFEMEEAG